MLYLCFDLRPPENGFFKEIIHIDNIKVRKFSKIFHNVKQPLSVQMISTRQSNRKIKRSYYERIFIIIQKVYYYYDMLKQNMSSFKIYIKLGRDKFSVKIFCPMVPCIPKHCVEWRYSTPSTVLPQQLLV